MLRFTSSSTPQYIYVQPPQKGMYWDSTYQTYVTTVPRKN